MTTPMPEIMSLNTFFWKPGSNKSWAAYSSVVEYADYGNIHSYNQPDAVAVSRLWGTRSQAKQRAFKAAMKTIGQA